MKLRIKLSSYDLPSIMYVNVIQIWKIKKCLGGKRGKKQYFTSVNSGYTESLLYPMY